MFIRRQRCRAVVQNADKNISIEIFCYEIGDFSVPSHGIGSIYEGYILV